MAVYLRSSGRDRVLLDTKKAHLDYEGAAYDLTGATLDFYDADWRVIPGTQGEDENAVPVNVLKITDPFTGLSVEVPLHFEAGKQIAATLNPPPRGLFRKKGT